MRTINEQFNNVSVLDIGCGAGVFGFKLIEKLIK